MRWGMLFGVLFFLMAVVPASAVGETCELSTGQACLLPYEVGSVVNYNVNGSVQISLCSSGLEFCETEVQVDTVGSFSYVVRQYSCGGLGCMWVNAVCLLGNLSVGNGVSAPELPGLPGSSSGLFDDFDLGLTLDEVLLEIVGFLSSNLIVSLLASSFVFFAVLRVLAFLRMVVRG